MAKYIVRMDDINPNMKYDTFEKIVKICNDKGFKPLIGVIPENRDEKLMNNKEIIDFWNKIHFMSKNGRVDISMHGTHHQYINNEAGLLAKYKINKQSEFAGLSYNEQYEKLKYGRRKLEERGIFTDIFMAPSHSFDYNTIRALKSLGFTRITDGVGLFPYSINGIIMIPQQIAVPRNMFLGFITICLHHDKMTDADIEKLQEFILKKDFISINQTNNNENVFRKVCNYIFEKVYYLGCIIKR